MIDKQGKLLVFEDFIIDQNLPKYRKKSDNKLNMAAEDGENDEDSKDMTLNTWQSNFVTYRADNNENGQVMVKR